MSLYSLTWGDYGTSLVSAIQLLRCHGDLVDCTLAAGGRSFPAHKIVLCAASPFLLDLLKSTSCKHPVVMLAGVAASDLEALLEFVYRGEVSVDHSQLPSLLHAAQCLNIQGLAPQNVSHKDDYTTIHINPSMQAHNVKSVIEVGNTTCVTNEELLSHLQNSEQTVEHEIIEEITPDPISISPIIIKDIDDYLPTRKRKRKTKKIVKLVEFKHPKVMREEEVANAVNEISLKPEETVPQKKIKVKTEKTMDHLSYEKMKTKSHSEQPAACAICGAIIRQSRNLRRHMELRHFSKQGRKSRKVKTTLKKENPNETMEAATTSMDTVTVTVESQNEQQQQQPLQQQQQQQHQIISQHENIDGTTSITIAHVESLHGQQIIDSFDEAKIILSDEQLESDIIATHEPTLRPQTELFRVGTVYKIEEHQE